MTSLGEIYTMELPLRAPGATTKTVYSSTIIPTVSDRPNVPPKCVVDLVTGWMGEGNPVGSGEDPDEVVTSSHGDEASRMLPAMCPALESAASLPGSPQSAVVPLVGLAKWTCIHPILVKAGSFFIGPHLQLIAPT